MSNLNFPAADDYRDAADGGPAFPKVSDDSRNGSSGMSLRDWFAGQALAGIAGDYNDTRETAKRAYAIANAMIAARKAHEQADRAKANPGVNEFGF